ncbi:MAG: LysR family transcriptional regulator [Rhizobiales bacterium]|nr:LysR family transcriptional regulator [Hyphomicrobiales bacterium]
MLNHLDDIRVFMRVAELENLSAAGRDLRKTPAVVSSRIARLEAATGVSLLWRTTRQVKLTPEGEIFLEHCGEIMRAVSRAEVLLAHEDSQPSGPVRISAPTGIGASILTPAFAEFSLAYPEINVQLHLTDRLSNLVEEKYDLAIRVSELRESGLIVRKLADNVRVICASPAYLEESGIPLTPLDLQQHRCLLLRFPGSEQYQWRLTGADGQVHNLPIKGPLDSDQTVVLKNWAISGYGLTLQNEIDVAAELKSGALVPVLQNYEADGHRIYAIYPQRRHMPLRLRTTLDFLVERFRDLAN